MTAPNPERLNFFYLSNGMRVRGTTNQVLEHPPLAREIVTTAVRQVVSMPRVDRGRRIPPLVNDHTEPGRLVREELADAVGSAMAGLGQVPDSPVHRRAIDATDELIAMTGKDQTKPGV